MEDKLGSILGNPELMQQIMTMAQSLGAQQETPPQPPPNPMPGLDLEAIQKLSGLMGRANIDGNQQALLRALAPYLSKGRISKLENAMRAAKMAGFAALALRQQGGQFLTGR